MEISHFPFRRLDLYCRSLLPGYLSLPHSFPMLISSETISKSMAAGSQVWLASGKKNSVVLQCEQHLRVGLRWSFDFVSAGDKQFTLNQMVSIRYESRECYVLTSWSALFSRAQILSFCLRCVTNVQGVLQHRCLMQPCQATVTQESNF